MEEEAQKYYEAYLIAYEKDYTEEHGSQLAICTSVCRWIIENWLPSGKVFGYYCDENPTAIVGEAEGGHDFVLVDDTYIIDFWYKHTYDPEFPAIVKVSDQTVYGDKSTWTEVRLIN